MLCSALDHTGIDETWAMIEAYVKFTSTNGYFQKKREDQNVHWMMQTIKNQLNIEFFQYSKTKKFIKQQIELVKKNKVSPFVAAQAVLRQHKSSL